MTTADPLQDVASIQDFMDGFDPASAARGHRYFNRGAVGSVSFDAERLSYQAAVQGTLHYVVTVFYSDDAGWDGECTRPVVATVKLFCDLKEQYPGSTRDVLHIRVLAELDMGASERFGPGGWEPTSAAKRAGGKPSQAELIPVLDRVAQHHVPRLLEALGAKWESYPGTWRVKVNKDFPETFVPWLAALPPNVEALLDPQLASLRHAPLAGTVRLEVEEAGVDWFDLKVVLDHADTELTPEELKLLLNARGRYVRLGRKGWRRLEFNLSRDPA